MTILLIVRLIASLATTAVSVIHINGKSSTSNSVIAGGSASPGATF
jgi:hypothetical protein